MWTQQRVVIADAGYGDYFVHRLGHGLGRSTRTAPSERVLKYCRKPAWCFPLSQIYLPGKFGVRPEEIVILRPDGL